MASLIASALSWVDRIRVNDSSRCDRRGRAVWVKRRRFGAGFVMRMANGFFRLAKNPVEAIATADEWRRWETECFGRLHGPEFSSGTDEDGAAWIGILPGESLAAHLIAGTLSPSMMDAAGVELRRGHAIDCPHYGSTWSHGDPHSGNFLYDNDTGRARLIDFEVRHRRAMPADDRHADDLLVLLQDVCGRCKAEAWVPLARAFVKGYGRPEIVTRMLTRLNIPSGIPRVWWAVRTTWMPRAELERRLAELRSAITPLAARNA